MTTVADVPHRNRFEIGFDAVRFRLAYFGVGWILALSALLRVGSIFVLQNYLHPETWEMGTYAGNLLSGNGYTFMGVPSAYQPPAYAVVLAWAISLFGGGPQSNLALELFRAALGVLLVYVIYRMSFSVCADRGIAQVTALCAAVYPAFIQPCNKFNAISWYIVLEAAAVLFLMKALQQRAQWKNVVFSAVRMGLLTQFRAEAIAIAVVFAALGVVLFVLPRYRMIIDPFLWVFAGNTAVFLLSDGGRGSPQTGCPLLSRDNPKHEAASDPAGAAERVFHTDRERAANYADHFREEPVR